MSYSQIFRRINRILKSKVNDFLDHLSGEDEELKDFDENLMRETRGSESSNSYSKTYQSKGQQKNTRSESSSQNYKQYRESKRKPGEKDDVFYYAVLGLTPNATVDEIKTAYKKLMAQYHPDRVATLGPDLQKLANEKAKAINEAYHIIERRRNFK